MRKKKWKWIKIFFYESTSEKFSHTINADDVHADWITDFLYWISLLSRTFGCSFECLKNGHKFKMRQVKKPNSLQNLLKIEIRNQVWV